MRCGPSRWSTAFLGISSYLTTAALAAPPVGPASQVPAPEEPAVVRMAPFWESQFAAVQDNQKPGLETYNGYIVFHLEFRNEGDAAAFRQDGVTPFHTYKRFVDAFVRVGDTVALKKLARNPALLWMEDGGHTEFPPPCKPQASSVTKGPPPEPIIRGDLPGYRGEGTVIAIIDSGIDFRHKDFIEGDGAQSCSRLLYFWDAMATWDAAQDGEARRHR